VTAARQILVLGKGASGKAAAELLAGEGMSVTVLDGDDAFPQSDFGLCVTSPGIALDHPWQQECRSRGVKVISELQLGAGRWRSMGGRMVAVTGSKGKSSVVKLVADVLGGVPCGNYGRPLCDVVNEAKKNGGALPWAVVEASSFQMETTNLPAGTFAAAAILNLQEDHLDRHGGVAQYHALKQKLLAASSVKFAPKDLASLEGFAPLLAGSYFDNPVLRANGLMAAALASAAGAAEDEVRKGFARFEPLPHRFRRVCETGGVEWIDDSKATSLAALAAGVEMAQALVPKGIGPKVRLIAGGLAKGDDPKKVIPCLQSGVQKVYLIGRCAEQFRDAWHSAVPCEVCRTLDQAVRAARRDASAGDKVVLSPGAASFDQFAGFGERGDAFAGLARETKET